MSSSSASEQRDSIANQALIEALRAVPEFRITLLELARKVTRRGKVDMDKASLYREELDLAIKEAESYSKETRRAVEWLKELVRRGSP